MSKIHRKMKNTSCKKMVLSDFHATVTLLINHLDNKATQRIHNQTINDLRMGEEISLFHIMYSAMFEFCIRKMFCFWLQIY